MPRLRPLVAVLVPMLVLAAPGFAATDPSRACDRAAQSAARATGVPVDVLRALTRTETGRRNPGGGFGPWPWTVNMEGAGLWFDDEATARAYATERFNAGARSFDIGCFQLNYYWHGDGFPSLRAMFEPRQNALYAARFLKSLYQEFGDWSRAAGAYHSRQPERARVYRDRFERLHAALGPDVPAGRAAPAPGGAAEAQRRVAISPRMADIPRARAKPAASRDYPLFVAADTAPRLGSLVPLGQGAARPLLPVEPQG